MKNTQKARRTSVKRKNGACAYKRKQREDKNKLYYNKGTGEE